jgi:hypothetical protein
MFGESVWSREYLVGIGKAMMGKMGGIILLIN